MAVKINEKKRGVSIRKVEANRQNALKSTGPKTPRGNSVAPSTDWSDYSAAARAKWFLHR
jgi:hypothetical protein